MDTDESKWPDARSGVDMARSPDADVPVELLVWARSTRGFGTAEAAKKIGVDESLLQAWERGEALPTIVQLRKVADVYKRPLAVFFLAKPPEEPSLPHDFRRTPDAPPIEYSAELKLAIRRARWFRDIALQLGEQMRVTPPTFDLDARRAESAISVAARIRRYLGVTTADQADAGDPYASLRLWRSAIERTGVLVFQAARISIDEMRGLSLPDFPQPVIVLNSADAVYGRVFTLIHEFAHLVLRSAGLCLVYSGDEALETHCNAIAGEVLVPRDELLADPVVVQNRRSMFWAPGQLRELSRRFGVSEEVVLRRLLEAGRTTREFYATKRGEFAMRVARDAGSPPYDVVLASQLGAPFIRLVLDAYHREIITENRASEYLSIKAEAFPKLEERAFS